MEETLSNDNIVVVRDMSFSRGNTVIFDHVNIHLQRGKITAIMGPSGTGKTTLLRLIGGQLYPDHGEIRVDDIPVHQLSVRKLFELRQRMGLLFQSGGLFTNLNVFENVAFPLREHSDLPEDMLHDLVLMKLEMVGLRGAASLQPGELSGGMARRVALARALALDPALMMYDEPFAGQDPITMSVLVSLIKRLNDALGLTSVVVSHDVPETCSIADYVYLVADGSVVAQGTPQELEMQTNPQVRQFMHGIIEGERTHHYPARTFAEDLVL